MPAVLVGTQYGPMLVPPRDRYIGAALMTDGVYCPNELAVWLAYVPVGGVVLDIGANLGSHTMGFAKQVGPTGRVIAVEPQRAIYHMLCGSLALTGTMNVDARNVACGASKGTAPMAVLDYDGPNNFGGLGLGRYKVPGVVHDTVTVEPIDAWNLKRVDFIKIDAEGMDAEVLEGASETVARCHPAIVAEWHEGSMIPAWLIDRGYSVFRQVTPLGEQFGTTGSWNIVGLPGSAVAPVSPWVEPYPLAVAA